MKRTGGGISLRTMWEHVVGSEVESPPLVQPHWSPQVLATVAESSVSHHSAACGQLVPARSLSHPWYSLAIACWHLVCTHPYSISLYQTHWIAQPSVPPAVPFSGPNPPAHLGYISYIP